MIFFLINWPTQLYLGIQSNPLKHDDIRTWRDQKATWRYLSRWTSLWISILSAALNFGQFWTMAAQCVIKGKKKRPEILVMTTIYTLWTIHKTTGHYNYKKKRTFCVDSKLQKCNNDLFDRFYSMTRVCNLFKKNKWLFNGHWLIWIWTLCYNKCEIWYYPLNDPSCV